MKISEAAKRAAIKIDTIEGCPYDAVVTCADCNASFECQTMDGIERNPAIIQQAIDEATAEKDAEIERLRKRNTDIAHELVLAQAGCDERDGTIADHKSEIERLKQAFSDARQESFFVREYLDEARDWFRQILEEAEASPNTIEEWRDGLCSGSVGAVVNFCRSALSETPEGGEVVFLVRQRIEKARPHTDQSWIGSMPDLTDEDCGCKNCGELICECETTKVCHWSLDDEEMSTWRGSCGLVWYFPDGATPEDSRLHYCPQCGGVVLVDGCPVLDTEALAGREDDNAS